MNFQEKVLRLASKIPLGKVSTYKQIAIACGSPKVARAVGNALNANPQPIKIPCHRIVYSDGKIGGYALGVRKKIKLLKKECIKVKNGKITDFKKLLFKF